MRTLLLSTGLLVISSAGAQSAPVSVAAPHTFDFGISGGYFNGLSGEWSLTMRNLGRTNLGLRASVAYSSIDGFNDNAWAAENASNERVTAGALYGTLGYSEESNMNLTLGLDGLFHLSYDAKSGLGFNGYVGGRYNMFSTTRFGPGGDVTWTSNQVGIGGGVLVSYPIRRNVYFTSDVGIDHYFPAPITQCGSDGVCMEWDENTNAPRGERFITPPSTVVKARVGLGVRF